MALRQMESAAIEQFSKWFTAQAVPHKMNLLHLPLSGQDEDVGADSLFTDATRFTLVEFKYSAAQLADETDKEKRKTLCQELAQVKGQPKAWHKQCHFICWTEGDKVAALNGSAALKTKLNVYSNQICHAGVFPDCGNLAKAAVTSTTMSAEKFSREYFQGKHSLEWNDFDQYLKWLLKIAGSAATSLQVIVHEPGRTLKLYHCSSLEALRKWVKRRKPKPAQLPAGEDPEDPPSPTSRSSYGPKG
jgi:hypothetical protein